MVMRYYINYQRGFVLVSVLVFLQIFVILILYNIRNISWESKIAHEYAEKHSQLTAAEKALKTAESTIANDVQFCQITRLLASKLLTQSLLWWQSNACAGNLDIFHYYYVIEHLQTDTCAEIADTLQVNSNRAVADYYRTTLLLVSTKAPGTRTILQSTFVISHAISEVCSGASHLVMSGRQFWHELI
jgi:hypothetical protein